MARRGASGQSLYGLRQLSEIAQQDVVAAAALGASKESGLEVIAIKLSTWSCLEIRMQDEVQYKE